LTESIIRVPFKYVEVADAVFTEEGASHGTVKSSLKVDAGQVETEQ
jgi:hypothetical protein